MPQIIIGFAEDMFQATKNIKEVIKYAKKKGVKTIGFSGFNGGYLNKNATISLHVNAKNYGLSEDSHHVLMHVLLQFLIEDMKKYPKRYVTFSLLGGRRTAFEVKKDTTK